MKRITLLVGMLALVAALIAAPAPAKAAMWVGVELGPNFMADSNLKFRLDGGQAGSINYKWDTKVLGGVTFGYHFINQGFLAYNWPDWMKYFQSSGACSHVTEGINADWPCTHCSRQADPPGRSSPSTSRTS